MDEMEQFPNYHPMIVHFPIMLLVLAAGMQLVALFTKNRGLNYKHGIGPKGDFLKQY